MGASDILDWARQKIADRVPKADLDQRNPDYIRDQLPGLWLLASLYFRADVRGLDRIPEEGPGRCHSVVATDPLSGRELQVGAQDVDVRGSSGHRGRDRVGLV